MAVARELEALLRRATTDNEIAIAINAACDLIDELTEETDAEIGRDKVLVNELRKAGITIKTKR